LVSVFGSEVGDACFGVPAGPMLTAYTPESNSYVLRNPKLQKVV